MRFGSIDDAGSIRDKVVRNGGLSRSENSAGIVLANSDNRNVDSIADVLEGWNFYDVTRSNLLERPAAAKRARVRASRFVAGGVFGDCAFMDSDSLSFLRKLFVPQRETGGWSFDA